MEAFPTIKSIRTTYSSTIIEYEGTMPFYNISFKIQSMQSDVCALDWLKDDVYMFLLAALYFFRISCILLTKYFLFLFNK